MLADLAPAVPELVRGSARLLVEEICLRVAKVAEATENKVCGVRRWALEVRRRSNHNNSPCALVHKLARICYATLKDKTPFGDAERPNRKITRETFVMPVCVAARPSGRHQKKALLHPSRLRQD